MFSVSYWYFISHRWVHFYCTHLSVMCLYMCLLIISLFFLILSWRLWLSVSLCSRLLWSIPDNVICWVPDVNLRLSRWFTLVCSWFYFFLFISRDQYICWQEVTIINPSNISFILILFSPLDAGGHESSWSRCPLIAKSKLLMVLSSPNLMGGVSYDTYTGDQLLHVW